jgi:DNA-binding GntR family transcriptional regulator
MTPTVQADSRDVSGSDTLSERAASLVERDNIAGDLAPGARLGIVDLAQRYEIGATPLREGLSRLISRGLIVGTPLRRRAFEAQPAMPICRATGCLECSHSASFDHRRRPEMLRTAMAIAFF